jgi:uncharacterized protein
MSDSLRDQLLKSGLVQKLKSEAKPAAPAPLHPKWQRQNPPRSVDGSASTNKPKPHHGAPSRQSNDQDLARAYALRAQQEKAEREQAQREAERVAREKKERKQKLAALLDGKALNSADAELPRHFPHGNKIRRIYCTPDQLARLNRGELGVVQLAGRYLLVDREIATQSQAIQPESLVLLCDPNAPADDDVPPDLVW